MMTPVEDEMSAGPRAWPCRWCAAAVPPDTTFCPACGHNAADIRGCTCPTCTARASHPAIAALQAPYVRVLVLRRDPDRTWRGHDGSAALFNDRGTIIARTAEDLLGLAIRCWSAGISLLLDHSTGGSHDRLE
jgi:hypothetical protein